MDEKPLHWSERAKLGLPPLSPEPPRHQRRGWSRKSTLRVIIALVAIFALAWGGIGALHLYNKLAGNSSNIAASVTPPLAQGLGTVAPSASSIPAISSSEPATTTSLTLAATSTTAPSSNPANSKPDKPGTPEAWGLATSALLTQLNGGRHDLLGTQLATPRIVRDEKQALADWWGVNNRDDLLAMLDWVDQGGHRKDWDQLAAYIASLSSSELSQFLTKVASDPEMKHQVDVVRKLAPKLGDKSLLGWDYARYISLCRWGFVCGYLTEKEAWDRIMPVAAMLQKTFDSWADLGENYMIGREFWSYEQMQKDGDLIRQAYAWLMSSSTSPWNLNVWNMDLGVKATNIIS